MRWYRDRNLVALSLAFLLSNIGWGMAWPYLPVYISMIGGSILYITLLSIMFNLFGSISQYPWARISDRTGHKKIFISLGNGLSGIMFYLMSLTMVPVMIVEYRVLQGIFSSMATPTASALIVELGKDNMGMYFGIFNSFIELGYTVGSLLGSMIYVLSGSIPMIFTVAMILFILSAFVSQFLIKEEGSRIDRSRIPFPTFRHEGRPGRFPLNIRDGINILKENRDIFFLSIGVFLVMSASGEVYSVLPVYFGMKFQESWIGFLYGVEAISVVAFTPIFGYLADRLNIKYIILFGISGYFITYILYYSFTTPQDMIIAEIFSGIKWSAFIVSISTYVGLVSPKGKESRSQAMINIAQSMGWVLGPAVAVPVVILFGFSFNILFSFIFIGLGMLVVSFFVNNLKSKKIKTENA
ncbi:MAG: MFS transporter [Thermoplasmata archaeon]